MIKSTFAGNTRRVVTLVVHLASTGLLVVPGTAVGEDGVAACEPRANTEPGRLNIVVKPDGLGIIPPCTPNFDFYIARNTPLRAIDVVIRASTRRGDVLSTTTAGIDLEGTDYGMFVAGVGVDPVADQTCPDLLVDVEIDKCRGKEAEAVDCPAVRVKVPKVFAGLSVSGEKLNICHDD